jgi:hypothetical protein
MSGITYRYDQSYSFMKKGVKHTIKENVIDGDKGLSVMFLEKKGDNFYRMFAKEIEKDTFEVTEKKDEVEQPTEKINEKELLKKLKAHKLEIIINYINNERGTYKGHKILLKSTKLPGYEEFAGGATKKKSSKKASKKSSKKASKKSTKK